MTTPSSEPNPPPAGSLQSMLARLRGMMQALKSAEPLPGNSAPTQTDLLPTWDAGGVPPQTVPAEIPAATPVAELAPQTGALSGDCSSSSASPAGSSPLPQVPGQLEPEIAILPPTTNCPACHTINPSDQEYCSACGLMFAGAGGSPAAATVQAERVRDRYEIQKLIGERGQCQFLEAFETAGPDATAVRVMLARQSIGEASASWPSLAWFDAKRSCLESDVWPRILDRFEEGGNAYLLLEHPEGLSLWDAWEDPRSTAELRFGWLIQLAESLQALHASGVLVEALRPELVTIDATGQARVHDLSQWIPSPLPAQAQLRASLYSAPELILDSDKVDARADLFTFGALLYSLHLGRELTEMDFELHGVPKPMLHLFSDCHPLFGRLISKTFCRDLHTRFPTDDGARVDATGFDELLKTLRQCQRTMGRVRLECAAWSSTGMMRGGNEDAFALLQAMEGTEDQAEDQALVLLADGMGGLEAGEVAARVAVQTLRMNLVEQKPFRFLTGTSCVEPHQEPTTAPHWLDAEASRLLLLAAVKEANQAVYHAAKDGSGRPGMGCTLEVVCISSRGFVVAHVGDSRTYHFHAGRLTQVTVDQTWVQRMVALGAMSQEEADNHPRKSELHQAIGGAPDVEPAVYEGRLDPGDVILVCSDGVTTHLSHEMLAELIQAASSAEACARQIVNWTNLRGGSDNSTVVVVRAR